MKKIFVLAFYSLSFSSLFADATVLIQEELNWTTSQVQLHPGDMYTTRVYSFENSVFSPVHPEIPSYANRVPVSGSGKIDISIKILSSSPISLSEDSKEHIKSIQFQKEVMQNRKDHFAAFSFIPIYEKNGGYYKIERFELEILFTEENKTIHRSPDPVNESVLATGDIYKLKIDKSGIYKLSFVYLNETLGINESTLNGKNFQVFGSIGGSLTEPLELPRMDDLTEIPVFIDNASGTEFTAGNNLLVYIEGPDTWKYDQEANHWRFNKNIYDNFSYIFIRTGEGTLKEMTMSSSVSDPEHQTNYFDFYKRYENDLVNLLADFSSTQGSGQRWFGEEFSNLREQNFTGFFNTSDIEVSEPIELSMNFAGRCASNSQVKMKLNGNTYTADIPKVNVTKIESTYARVVGINETITGHNGNISLTIEYPEVSGAESEGWLDYIQLKAKRKLNYNQVPLPFTDLEAINYNTSGFTISNANNNLVVWDITAPNEISSIDYSFQNDIISFGYNSEAPKQFIVFNPAANLNSPVSFEKINNQNIHAITDAEYLIIYHPDFKEAVQTLYDHRSSYSAFKSYMIPVGQVFNEFSGGRMDPTAIRNFAKMIYDRNPDFKYLLLFGDGSYDYKHIDESTADQNFVPVYETIESLYPIGAFPTDDYYGLLSDQEGDDLKGELDLAVGRIPVRTSAEALAVVNKILKYETDPATFGSWRNRIGFAADDEDSNTHVNQADDISEEVGLRHPNINQEKIYFDAFQQESTPGGERYPDATKSMADNIYKGMLTYCYLGHGGPNGWSQERVLKIGDINAWDNPEKMPLLITATCSFASYDDPAITSAGEVALLKEEGGAIGLFTTVRAVYSLDNKRLTQAVFDTIFTKVDGEYMEIGEIIRRAKNSNWEDTIRVNARKFSLLGDPGLRLAIPKYNIYTSTVNGKEVSSGIDTLRALDKVTIEGYIGDANGQLFSDFNGKVYTSLFDKKFIAQTLGNDSGSPVRDFKVQNRVLFKGAATVQNGKFSFSFIIPKDIDYNYGNGKLSYYATDGYKDDAAGYFEDVIIGGTSESGIIDDQGPEIELYMNDENFVFGGITDRDPVLFAKLTDDFGINISGTSIGHDLTAVLDDDSQKSYILNSFYEAELDDYTKGTIRFPFSDLEPGKHSLNLKAWDIANNSSEKYLEFYVTDDSEDALAHVLNYPNPFSTQTCFQFEHNLADTELEVLIYIYTISGQLVKTIEHQGYYDGFRVTDIKWDGKDDFGTKLANGVYLYKIKVKASQFNLRKESAFEKLVILK